MTGTHEDGSPPLPVRSYDVRSDVDLESVMDAKTLGPNGGMVYAVTYMQKNIAGIIENIISASNPPHPGGAAVPTPGPPYYLFDCPGQVELFTHSTSVASIISSLTLPPHKGGTLGCNLACVNCLSCAQTFDAAGYISGCLVSTMVKIRLELGCVGVMTKMDMWGQQGGKDWGLKEYLEGGDMGRLVQHLDVIGVASPPDHGQAEGEYRRVRDRVKSSRFHARHARLTRALGELVDDFGLNGYLPVGVNDGGSVGVAVGECDKVNGYGICVIEGGEGGEGGGS
ncbi:hypothetical protein TrRE_jg3812 [Triparma retinervis]|uniref:GPN-loop GTPase 2 n=1 Tax=Triparma retinervis TaxID=2557542 RepID=A0A9W7E4Q8_9STRA|nr:hypothetical protein TrRE_jg3812 [Triparma retinervis]